jgi:protein-L-isoaspartate(D-aspartate) O-methyltransferase
MVQGIEARGVRDPLVLAALSEVPRHLFADNALASRSYGDHALPIGWSQTLSRPLTVARMSEALALSGGERVLEIGTGSGYQAAVLARIGCHVFSVERIAELAQKARRLLDSIGAATVLLKVGDGADGWREFAPFDRILITAGAKLIPDTLRAQLADPGTLVAPLGDAEQEIVVLRREMGAERTESIGPCRFVPFVRGTSRGGPGR